MFIRNEVYIQQEQKITISLKILFLCKFLLCKNYEFMLFLNKMNVTNKTTVNKKDSYDNYI